MTVSEYQAPWGRLLKVTSILSTLVVLAVSAVLMSRAGVSTRIWPSIVPWLPLLLLASTLPFVVRGYRVRDGILFIDRLFWATPIPLTGLKSVEVMPDAMKGGLRLCGNGGMFSFTGWWWSRRLGHYRPYVTDLPRCVVLRFQRRTIVVSPEDPEVFAQDLKPLLEESAIL